MHPYSPISWLYVHRFLGQNFKRLDLGVIAGYLEKRISVAVHTRVPYTPNYKGRQVIFSTPKSYYNSYQPLKCSDFKDIIFKIIDKEKYKYHITYIRNANVWQLKTITRLLSSLHKYETLYTIRPTLTHNKTRAQNKSIFSLSLFYITLFRKCLKTYQEVPGVPMRLCWKMPYGIV